MRQIHLAAMGAVIAGWIGSTAVTGLAQKSDVSFSSYSSASDEQENRGKSLTYWLNVIRARDEEQISLAFDALRSMRAKGWPAVPELTQIIAAPYTPIRIGKDSDEEIAGKLYDIELRSQAIDVLASIGEGASPATLATMDWALTLRVVPEEILTRDQDERFIDLVTLDAEYRMRIVGAIAEFGEPARPILARLVKSSNAEKRKLSVMILGTDALTIAADLMKSESCDDKQLATTILSDMQPLVAKVYLSELKARLACNTMSTRLAK